MPTMCPAANMYGLLRELKNSRSSHCSGPQIPKDAGWKSLPLLTAVSRFLSVLHLDYLLYYRRLPALLLFSPSAEGYKLSHFPIVVA